MRAGEAVAEHEDGSRGCLIVVATYSHMTRVIAPLVSEAARRILLSPVLGDFIELRHVDLGDRPSENEDDGYAVSCIGADIVHPKVAADQNYFAIIIADRSARHIERIFGECQSDSVLSAMPLRYCGFAAVEDRDAVEQPDSPRRRWEMVIPRSGGWTNRRLADAMRYYAEEMLQDFGTGHEPGLTPDQLAAMGGAGRQVAASSAFTDDDIEISWEPDPADASSDHRDQHDADRSAWTAGVRQNAGQAAPALTDQSRLQAGERRPADDAPPVRVPESGRGGRPEELRPTRLRAVRLPAARLWRSDPPVSVDFARAVLYLVITESSGLGDRTLCERARTLMRELDSKIAGVDREGWRIRLYSERAEVMGGALRMPGSLSRRDIKHAHANADFGQSLKIIGGVLRRDLETMRRSGSGAAGKTVVVIFAVEVPLADVVTAEAYEGLAEFAEIVWVVPEDARALLSSVFAERATVLIDGPGTSDDVITLITADPSGDLPPSSQPREQMRSPEWTAQ